MMKGPLLFGLLMLWFVFSVFVRGVGIHHPSLQLTLGRSYTSEPCQAQAVSSSSNHSPGGSNLYFFFLTPSPSMSFFFLQVWERSSQWKPYRGHTAPLRAVGLVSTLSCTRHTSISSAWSTGRGGGGEQAALCIGHIVGWVAADRPLQGGSDHTEGAACRNRICALQTCVGGDVNWVNLHLRNPHCTRVREAQGKFV